MIDTNFYSYMYSQASTVAFDELAEVVDLSKPETVQMAFELYLEDNIPPYDLKEALLEEKFYESDGEGTDGNDTYLRYDMEIPGVEDKVDTDVIKAYLEDFVERIGGKNDADSKSEVEVELLDNERGGVDIDIYIALSGKQVKRKD